MIDNNTCDIYALANHNTIKQMNKAVNKGHVY